jgi:predicted aspartyl protease
VSAYGLLSGCASAPPATSPPVVVDVPIQVVENMVLVAASVNDGPTALLIVDTGAASTMLTPQLLARLGIVVPADAPKRKVHVVGGQTLDVPFVRIARIKIGGATMLDQEVGVYQIHPDAPILDGLLGGDFLHRYRVTLDRSARRMRLEPIGR